MQMFKAQTCKHKVGSCIWPPGHFSEHNNALNVPHHIAQQRVSNHETYPPPESQSFPKLLNIMPFHVKWGTEHGWNSREMLNNQNIYH
eukprot:5778886-Amphidinium_carterae.1